MKYFYFTEKLFVLNRCLLTIIFFGLSYGVQSQITLVKDLHSGTEGLGTIEKHVRIGNVIYFLTEGEIIKTDGTASGTEIIELVDASRLIKLHDNIYYDDLITNYVYKSDGSVDNAEIYISPDDNLILGDLLQGQDVMYVVMLGEGGRYQYVADGTSSGIVGIDKPINYFLPRSVVDNDLYFISQHGDNNEFTELYKVENGLAKLIAPVENYQLVYDAEAFGTINQEVFYFATINEGSAHTEMFSVHENGLEKIIEFKSNFYARRFTNIGGTLFFTLHLDYDEPAELWKTDGSAEGTVKIDNDIRYSKLYAGVNLLYYIVESQRGRPELWCYNLEDETKTRIAENVAASVFEAGPYYIDDNIIYFFVHGPDGPELWRSNGTSPGTEFLADSEMFIPRSSPLAFNNITILGKINDELIFSALAENYGNELFKFSLNNIRCGASKVVSFHQGRKKNHRAIDKKRSHVKKALNNPQENDTYNFVSLGFGGSITLKFPGKVYDDGSAEPDIILVETSFGRADDLCFKKGKTSYPEEAFVEVSHDGKHWYSLPNSYCRTSFLDIKPAVERGMPYAKFIRITDATDKSRFGNNADGFDVDGVITCRQEVESAKKRLTNARSASRPLFDPEFFNLLPNEVEIPDLEIYPNPVKDANFKISMNLDFEQTVSVKIIDLNGRLSLQEDVSATSGQVELMIDVGQLKQGIYFVNIDTNSGTERRKLIVH